MTKMGTGISKNVYHFCPSPVIGHVTRCMRNDCFR